MSCSILIVDDNKEDRYLLKRLIKKTKISETIFECSNGKEGIDFLLDYERNIDKYSGNFPPTLIFLDIHMPIMNGFEFLDRFNEIKHTQDSKYSSMVLTMITSSEREEDRKKALSYNFVKGFVVKMPDCPEDFLTVIEEHCPTCLPK